jgi:hypothetical protein
MLEMGMAAISTSVQMNCRKVQRPTSTTSTFTMRRMQTAVYR